MKVTVSENKLTIETDITLNKQSRSGNSTIIATTRGQQYIGNIHGRPTYVQLNVMQMEGGAAGAGIFEVENEAGDNEKKQPKRAA